MHIKPYDRKHDYERVGDFLIETYQPGEVFYNWLQPRWEYMHYHTLVNEINLEKIGIFEEAGRIVGVVNIEHTERHVYLQVRPGYDHIKVDMFDYAEANFQGMMESRGRLFRAIYIHEFDATFEQIAKTRGYERWDDYSDDMSRYLLDKPVPDVTLPDGYRLQSLADDLDLHQVNRVLWRGFDHPGPPPDEGIEGRRFMMRAPNFRKDLTIVVVAPDGNYVSYCGNWVVPANRIAYVEPVATDPDYRRMGLGQAAVLESLRRAAALGAEVAWVGSGQEFYKGISFERMFAFYPWVKFLD